MTCEVQQWEDRFTESVQPGCLERGNRAEWMHGAVCTRRLEERGVPERRFRAFHHLQTIVGEVVQGKDASDLHCSEHLFNRRVETDFLQLVHHQLRIVLARRINTGRHRKGDVGLSRIGLTLLELGLGLCKVEGIRVLHVHLRSFRKQTSQRRVQAL